MHVRLVCASIAEVDADAVIVNLFEGVTRPGGATGALDRALGGMISRVIEHGEFKGELGECLVLHVTGFPFRKVVIAGLGDAATFDLESVRRAAGAAAKTAAKGDVKRIATIVHGAGIGGLDPASAAQAVVEGSLLALYRFDRFKTSSDTSRDKFSTPEELVIAELDRSKLTAMGPAVERGVILADAVRWVRDMVNTPSNWMTPSDLAQAASAMARREGLECRIIERDEMEALQMGALLGVARGSVQPPKLIVLRYRGGANGQGPLALVGKGVTFDTGGISLKPSQGMAEMKGDMAGAAAVLGAMQAIARLKPRLDVLAVVPCTENMPSGSALKPGDVLRAMNGKTIEVDNTDAEGRLILADAVAYAVAQGATAIVDVATLTGACVIALGDVYSGVVSTSDEMYEQLQAAAARTGERFWRLPAHPDYRRQYKSDVADLKNTGGRKAGAITGALIISEFAGDAKWLHLDIAGTAFIEKEREYEPKGATGVAVRTLAELASVLAGQ